MTELEVVGAGFGRTGTASLYEALNTLGYVTHHMFEVVARRDQAQAWLQAWCDRAAGRPVDWHPALGAGGFTAAVDWPSAAFVKELLTAYPRAKVILTLRDFDKWYDSARDTIYAIQSVAASIRPPPYLAPLFQNVHGTVAVAEAVIWQGTFSGRFEDREHARQVYDAHIAEVRRVVPPGQLLEFRITDGWGPLCDFLGKPVPERPFPHANDSADFRRRMQRMRVVARLLDALPASGCAMVATAVAVAAAVAIGRVLVRSWQRV
ncbi:hypothetical protein PLESTB_001372300 [Pleodorina starrii]|uniref:Sulfotransferase family protein n=1 Tax=Pleodorina starrii TaxID=330485 RepID=A0A9W6BV53_9CHLO|nr:hypothetical protein PLESTM_000412800 [Pleodorina starrii]GLC58540.1 hypothetical protein PLESTB_001372300 [Pleodorina starrii]GLC74191.1 hypothetical protein PLESTF_001472000 [Pleodorina starrii]